jgi:hypothetical protein
MHTNHHHYGYLSHLKHPFLGGVIILSLSLSSLYAGAGSAKSATPPATTKTDANGINAKANSSAIGVNGANNTTVINKTIIINNYGPAKGGGHTAKETKKTPPKKTITTAKTPAKPLPKTPVKPLPKTPTKVAVKAVTPQPAVKNDCLASHSKDYCNTTGKLLNKH